jgi:hypothetical protein
MKEEEGQTESDRIANSVIIFSGSGVLLAIIIMIISNDNFLSSIFAIIIGFIISISYYIWSNLKASKQKKESLTVDVDGS